MAASKCPICGAGGFYVKDPEDQFETYEFHLDNGKVVFDSQENETAQSDTVNQDATIYCGTCAWNGTLEKLK